jgi:hypothetical protein
MFDGPSAWIFTAKDAKYAKGLITETKGVFATLAAKWDRAKLICTSGRRRNHKGRKEHAE